MAARVTFNTKSPLPRLESRVTAMFQKGTIEKELAGFKAAQYLLESDTLRDLLIDFPKFEIRDGVPFKSDIRSEIPGFHSLIYCINTQWVRHFLKKGECSKEEIPGVGDKSDNRWRIETPQIFGVLFKEAPNSFLNADILAQQTMLLQLDTFLKSMLPDSYPDHDMIVDELEHMTTLKRAFLRNTLIVISEELLNRVSPPTIQLESKGE